MKSTSTFVTFLGIATDVIFGLPVGSVAAATFERVLSNRVKQAEKIALEELGQAVLDTSLLDDDSFITKAQSYAKCAIEGSARVNLRILARVLASEYQNGPPVRADEFLHYVSIISSLREEEIVLLGSLLRNRSKVRSSNNPGDRRDDFSVYQLAQAELCPSYFSSREEMAATAGGMQRTGYILHNGALSGGTWVLTVLAEKIENIVNFGEVLKAEGVFPLCQKS